MPSTSPIYRATIQAAVPLVPVVLREARQRAAHQGRLDAPAQLQRWAASQRDPARPLAWFHAPSVGEGLQARAVIRAFARLRPDVQLLFTHFSPSAQQFAATTGADWHGYLCYDRPHDIEQMLAAARPDALVFAKLDLWPELAVRAAGCGTRVAMVAATVTADSSRLRWPARNLAMPGYRALDLAMAVSDRAATRLSYLGCRPDRIVVTGDPRIDSVLDVVEAHTSPVLPLHRATTMVAGSTWPADDAVVLAAYAEVLRKYPEARLVIAPHDPTPEHLDALDAAIRDAALPHPVRLSAFSSGTTAHIIMVDRTGILATLYSSGAIAYVGGGFGRNGLHSVLEPAAARSSVITGPRDPYNDDVAMLERAGALQRLPLSGGVAELARLWSNWIARPDAAQVAGNAGRAAIEAARGASERSAELLNTLFAPSRGRHAAPTR